MGAASRLVFTFGGLAVPRWGMSEGRAPFFAYGQTRCKVLRVLRELRSEGAVSFISLHIHATDRGHHLHG